jgi:hypothetical protein
MCSLQFNLLSECKINSKVLANLKGSVKIKALANQDMDSLKDSDKDSVSHKGLAKGLDNLKASILSKDDYVLDGLIFILLF